MLLGYFLIGNLINVPFQSGNIALAPKEGVCVYSLIFLIREVSGVDSSSVSHRKSNAT